MNHNTKLRRLRRNKRILAVEMAELLNVSINTYYDYENNPSSCPLGRAKKICDALGVTLEEIYEGEVSNNERK